MTVRHCPDCGLVEQRTCDHFKRETTNLDPISGRCVPCLVASVKVKTMPASHVVPFDVRAAAARNDE